MGDLKVDGVWAPREVPVTIDGWPVGVLVGSVVTITDQPTLKALQEGVGFYSIDPVAGP